MFSLAASVYMKDVLRSKTLSLDYARHRGKDRQKHGNTVLETYARHFLAIPVLSSVCLCGLNVTQLFSLYGPLPRRDYHESVTHLARSLSGLSPVKLPSLPLLLLRGHCSELLTVPGRVSGESFTGHPFREPLNLH